MQLPRSIVSGLLCQEHIGLFRLLSLCVYVSGTLLVTRPPPLFPPSHTTPLSQLHTDLGQHNVYGYPVNFTREEDDLVGGVVAALASVIIASLLLIINR